MSTFRMPAIRDLTGDVERGPAGKRSKWSVADLVLVRRDQVEELARTAEVVDELPEGPGVLFVPFAAGYLGVPACAGADPELTCWPMAGGVDDDPRTWVCVCRPPQSGSSSAWQGPPLQRRPCALIIELAGSRLLTRCITLACEAGCRLVRDARPGGLMQFVCVCGGA